LKCTFMKKCHQFQQQLGTRRPGPAWGPNLVTQPNPTRFLGWVGLRLKNVGLGWVQLSDPEKPKFWEVLRANVVWKAGAHFHTSRSRVVCDCLLQTECALRIGAFSRTNEVLQLWSLVGPISLLRLLVCAYVVDHFITY